MIWLYSLLNSYKRKIIREINEHGFLSKNNYIYIYIKIHFNITVNSNKNKLILILTNILVI